AASQPAREGRQRALSQFAREGRQRALSQFAREGRRRALTGATTARGWADLPAADAQSGASGGLASKHMTMRSVSFIAAAGLAVAWLGATAPPAQADPSSDVVRDLAIDIQIDDGGLVHVTETYDWDFGDREGLGFRRELAQRFTWPDDPELMRVYEYQDMWIDSPSGAPAEGWIAGDGAYLVLDLGAPDGSGDTRTGVQTYELRY